MEGCTTNRKAVLWKMLFVMNKSLKVFFGNV